MGGTVVHPPRRDQLYENVITTTSRILRTEVSMFHCGLRVAGQADCLCTDPAGNIVIWDWKRSKEIRFDGQQQMKRPFDHLPQCNYWEYALQLNVYRYILESGRKRSGPAGRGGAQPRLSPLTRRQESEYGLSVSGMFLGVVHPLRDAPLCLQLPRMDEGDLCLRGSEAP